MTPYQYVKKQRKKPIRRPLLVSFLLILCGCMVLFWTGWPIVSFLVFTEGVFAKIVSPVGEKGKQMVDTQPHSPVVLAAMDEVSSGKDYSNANTWFPTSPQKKIASKVNTYTLSIPKLKIFNAIVAVSGDDLNKSLVHYGGTAVPGTYGVGVVFGHSILPQFYDPKNYRSIFSLLPTIKKGDRLVVEYDRVRYMYEVFELEITNPDDLSVLEQQYDDSYLTLVTCVPPGTYLKRLHVKTKLLKE